MAVLAFTVLGALLVIPPLPPRGPTTSAAALVHGLRDTYRRVEIYHAVWRVRRLDEPAARDELEVVFDRPGDRLMVRRQVWRLEDGRWAPTAVGELLVFDGRTVQVARRHDGLAPWKLDRVDPALDVSWWTLRRLISLEPIDLPLLMGEHPLLSWLDTGGAARPEVVVDEPSGSCGLEIRATDTEETMWVGLRADAILIDEATREPAGMEFTLRSLAIDEPVDPDLFRMERLLEPTSWHASM